MANSLTPVQLVHLQPQPFGMIMSGQSQRIFGKVLGWTRSCSQGSLLVTGLLGDTVLFVPGLCRQQHAWIEKGKVQTKACLAGQHSSKHCEHPAAPLRSQPSL